ncbi:MAG TPA: condensation domain-containing protein, partial [Streptosporangiaceae bacterium]
MAPTADAVPGRDPGATDLPLSYAQEQLWFIDEFHHGLPAHNLPCLLRLSGPLDAAALCRALAALAARHEPLRTRLLAGSDGMPVQVADPPAPGRPGTGDLTDLSGLDPKAAQDTLASLAAADALRVFRLAAGSLLRTRLVRLDAAEHALVLVTHQAVFDEQSWAVLISDLAALYQAEVTGGGSGLAELAVQAADVALWERRRLSGAYLADLEEHWRGALAEFPVSRFPADRARPLFASHDGAVVTARLDAGLLASLRELSAAAGTTLDVTLLAGIQALLARCTGQDDVITGYLGAARPTGLAAVIGFLSATLPVRTDASGDPSVTELLRRVHAAVHGARQHAALPFARIVEALRVERDTGRFPLFQVGFSWAEPAAEPVAAGVTFRRADVGLAASSYDISFAARPGPGGLDLTITYTPALFDPETVTRLAGHLEVLLRGAAADPSAPLSRLPVLTEAERHRELIEWNDTATVFPSICIHQGFEEWAARSPEAIAAQYEDERWSYAELDRRARQVAGRLREAGVGPEVLVGVCMATSLDRLAVLLGVWKAGGGYVPLDPGLPADRLSFMISDTGMSVIVADEASAASVPAGLAPLLPALSVLAGRTASPDDASPDSSAPEDSGVTPANVAYVIYTSGSTGQPKGVVVEHRQAINFLQGMVIAWKITPDSAVLGFAAYTFDVSVMDMFMPLL